MKYYATRGNDIKKHTIIAAIVGGFLLLYIAITTKAPLIGIISIVDFATLLIRRPVFVTEEGLNQLTDFRIFKSNEFWEFSEMTEINYIESQNEEEINMYFEKKSMPKMFPFKKEDAKAILLYIEENYPNIVVNTVDESEEEIAPY